MKVIGSSRVSTGGVGIIGLSTDEKPTAGIVVGSRFKEVDTGREYVMTEAGWLLDLQNTANRVWDVDTMDWVAMTQPTLSADTVNIDLTDTNNILSDIYDTLNGSLVVETTEMAKRVDEASATVMYVGDAPAGSGIASSVWRIKKVDTTSGVVITWADGNTNFDNRWDQRTGLSYS